MSKNPMESNNKKINGKYKTVIPGVSMTKSEFARTSDVNYIVNKFLKTGVIPYKNIGVFEDVSNIPDFRECNEFVLRAKASFDNLDINIKNKFQNDPQRLIDYLKDDSNIEESYKLGLRVRPSDKDALKSTETKDLKQVNDIIPDK